MGVGKNAALGNVVISLSFMLGCIPPMLWLNTAGRRPIVDWQLCHDDAGAGGFGADPGYGDLAGSDGLCGVCLLLAGRVICSGSILMNFSPTDIRASAVGVIMSLSRIGTIVSTWALPIFINNYGISNTMLMGAGISLFGLLISRSVCPEHRGMSLAQTSNMTIRGQRMG